MEKLKFLKPAQAFIVKGKFGTPLFVYNEDGIRDQINYYKNMPSAFGKTIRYSLKGNANRFLLRVIESEGLHFDASSGWEAMRAIDAGIDANKILLTSQEAPANLKSLVSQGVIFDATSLHQLENYGKLFPGTDISIRINPGEGTGGINRLVSGGPKSSFGIWYEYLPDAVKLIEKYKLHLVRIHQHIGSGHNPEKWYKISCETLNLLKKFPTVEVLNLGGGYRIKSLITDEEFDYAGFLERIKQKFVEFFEVTGRKIHLELEPGTAIMGNNGSLVTEVIDKVDTGSHGFKMLKVDSGITETARPGLYGAIHPMVIVPANANKPFETEDYLVMGHCCIQGDHFTPMAGNPEEVLAVKLQKAEIGDILILERAGGYCANMSLKNFNSFPEAAEVLYTSSGTFELIRNRQTFEQMIQNETVLESKSSLAI